ncbi:MAG: hypothetical protein HY079_00690 [Elusimicrobia bacterium]|nr:hypothetical protein [Elusimicrobiota bacterium]
MYRAAGAPLLCALAGAGLAVLAGRRGGPRPVAETALGGRTLDAALAAALVVYAAAVAATARELTRWPVAAGGARVPVPACTDGRAAALLEMAARAGRDDAAAAAWLDALDRAAGDEASAASGGRPFPEAARPDLAAYDRFVARRPRDPAGWRGRGVLKAVRGDAAGAAADLERALALSPGDLEAAVSLASLPGAGPRARALLRKALSLSSARKGEPAYARAAELARPGR